MSDRVNNHRETTTFAAGCFWGVEETFRGVPGVKSTVVGYSGGHYDNPSYRDVCSGKTGHAEVVQVTYDPDEISYEDLLRVFWETHDPTAVERQGSNVDGQYRSAIFFHTEEQEQAAKKSKEKLEQSGRFQQPIVTQIAPVSTFFRAEDYHQQYLAKRSVEVGNR